MAKNDNQVDDKPVDEQQDEPVVELDRQVDVQGELVENPKVEEVADEEGAKPEEPETPAGEGETAQPETEAEETGDEERPSSEAEADVSVEKDEAGVYDAPTATDPGQFQPKGDYAFEITTTDGKSVKITNQQEADAFATRLDENPELISASQFTKFNRGVSRMDSGIAQEQADFQKSKDEFERQQAQFQTRDNQIKQWNNEINYLQAKGLIPEIAADKNNDWLANKSDPAVKARMDIFEWMDRENKAREQAGLAPVMSAVDAFTMMRAEQRETALAEEAAGEKRDRQVAGSRIGGNAPFAPEDEQPPGKIVGVGGSLRDLMNEIQT